MRSIVTRLFTMLTPHERSRGVTIILLLVLSVLLDFAGLASFIPVIYVIADAQSANQIAIAHWLNELTGVQDTRLLYVGILLGLITFFVVKNAVTNAITREKARYAFNFGGALSSRLLSRYLAQPWISFTTADHAKEVNRIANQPIAFANNVVLPIGTILSEGLIFLILLAVILVFNPTAFFFLAGLLIPVVVVYSIHRRRHRDNGIDLMNHYRNSLKLAGQAVQGFPEIQAFGRGKYFTNRFSVASSAFAKASATEHAYHGRFSRLTELIAVTAVCSIVIYSIAFESDYRKTILLLAIYAGVSFRLLPSFNRILHALTQIRTHAHLFDEVDPRSTISVATNGVTPATFASEIKLNNISFQYPESALILDQVTAVFKKGEKIAFTGKSGSGKTTLLLIIMRFLRPTHGAVLIDGVPLEMLSSDSFRNLVAYVPQNPYILDATLAENIAFGITPDQIQQNKILDILNSLDLNEMLERMPHGLATLLGENGIRLSGGQRQRIAIARALYGNAEILLLDEVTSQLDSATEQEILATLQKVVMQKKTIIMITHHTSLLDNFDVVLNFENGVITTRRPKTVTHA